MHFSYRAESLLYELEGCQAEWENAVSSCRSILEDFRGHSEAEMKFFRTLHSGLHTILGRHLRDRVRAGHKLPRRPRGERCGAEWTRVRLWLQLGQQDKAQGRALHVLRLLMIRVARSAAEAPPALARLLEERARDLQILHGDLAPHVHGLIKKAA